MRIHSRSVAAAVLAVVLTGVTFSVHAQERAAPPAGEVAPNVEVSAVEASLAAMEANAGLEEAAKELLRPKYQEALEAAKAAVGNAKTGQTFKEALITGPGEIADLKSQLAALPSVESAAKVTVEGSAEDLQKQLDAQRGAASSMKDELLQVEDQLTRLRERPVEISKRVPEAQRELTTVQEQLSSPQFAEDSTSPGRVADRIVLGAKEAQLNGELQMLKQEELSQAVREAWLQARRDLLTRQVENATAVLKRLESARDRNLTKDAQRVVSEAGVTLGDSAGEDEEVQALAAEVEDLAKQFEGLVAQLKKISADHQVLTDELTILTREDQIIREQLQSSRASEAMAQRLFDLRQRLPSRRGQALRVKGRQDALGEMRFEALEVGEKLREQVAVKRRFADRPGEVVGRILSAREEVLKKLQTQYGALTRSLAALTIDEARYLEKARTVRAYLEEELFWVKSSPTISARTVTDIPHDLKVLFGPGVWPEFGRALLRAAGGAPFRGGVIVFIVLGLLVARRRLINALLQTGTRVRRISTDHYAHTGKALLYTSLLALPIPLLMGYLSWALGWMPEPSPWLRAMSRALWWSAVLALLILLVIAGCRRGGLGSAHFRWNERVVTRLRRTTRWIALVYIPAFFVLRVSFYGDAVDQFDSIGRVCFVVAHLWSAILLWKLLWPSKGVLTSYFSGNPGSLLGRLRYLWFPLVILCPLVLVGLACRGYLFTAALLSLELTLTAAIIVGGVTLYWLTMRWFMIRERRLALADAIEERRARQEAAAAEAEGQEDKLESDEVVSIDIDEDELDLPSIGEQTRNLLKFVIGIGVGLVVVLLWRETLPILSGLDKVRTGGGFSLLNLAQAAFVVLVTVMAHRNLPGLLELAVFGGKDIARGTRVAIITLCQYALIAVGLTLIFTALHVDWAKFGWIAAALSVGLGFGMQEVVANFVCGLILLFERPVRVGDVVTVESMTGTVTKIRMRATTIINWDRQEYVVPNKTFVTTSILNWTLSSSVNRVIIEVGVAYGSDTKKARGIMLQVAKDHPLVLDDPAPLASFEEFADSNLILRLRAYLPDVDCRIRTITELNAEIDRRLAEEGIEIAFPQRDLHVRSWEGEGGFAGPAADPGKT